MYKTSGIYKIQSQIKPDKYYIGSAINVANRWCLHLADLKKNEHHTSKLQNHYNKYGKDDLVFIIIEPCLPEFLIIREQYYIDTLKPFFNSAKIAGSCLGIKRSKETCDKISESRKGKPSWNKGKKLPKQSEEFCKKRSEYMKGNKLVSGKTWQWTEKNKQKLRGENNHNFGKHPSKESEQKRIESRKGLRKPLRMKHYKKLV